MTDACAWVFWIVIAALAWLSIDTQQRVKRRRDTDGAGTPTSDPNG